MAISRFLVTFAIFYHQIFALEFHPRKSFVDTVKPASDHLANGTGHGILGSLLSQKIEGREINDGNKALVQLHNYDSKHGLFLQTQYNGDVVNVVLPEAVSAETTVGTEELSTSSFFHETSTKFEVSSHTTTGSREEQTTNTIGVTSTNVEQTTDVQATSEHSTTNFHETTATADLATMVTPHPTVGEETTVGSKTTMDTTIDSMSTKHAQKREEPRGMEIKISGSGRPTVLNKPEDQMRAAEFRPVHSMAHPSTSNKAVVQQHFYDGRSGILLQNQYNGNINGITPRDDFSVPMAVLMKFMHEGTTGLFRGKEESKGRSSPTGHSSGTGTAHSRPNKADRVQSLTSFGLKPFLSYIRDVVTSDLQNNGAASAEPQPKAPFNDANTDSLVQEIFKEGAKNANSAKSFMGHMINMMGLNPQHWNDGSPLVLKDSPQADETTTDHSKTTESLPNEKINKTQVHETTTNLSESSPLTTAGTETSTLNIVGVTDATFSTGDAGTSISTRDLGTTISTGNEGTTISTGDAGTTTNSEIENFPANIRLNSFNVGNGGEAYQIILENPDIKINFIEPTDQAARAESNPIKYRGPWNFFGKSESETYHSDKEDDD